MSLKLVSRTDKHTPTIYFQICLDITRIVNMMSQTPYGSMSMNDFRRQQFVLVGGTLKLSDVDDTGFEDPICTSQQDCQVVFSSANFSQRLTKRFMFYSITLVLDNFDYRFPDRRARVGELDGINGSNTTTSIVVVLHVTLSVPLWFGWKVAIYVQ